MKKLINAVNRKADRMNQDEFNSFMNKYVMLPLLVVVIVVAGHFGLLHP